jgi:uncharacterized protein YecE (DUF72 family)
MPRLSGASAVRSRIRIGISGWRYAAWRGKFYPTGLTQRRELGFAAERFDTIELNGSFYSLQRPESYEAWYAAVPPGFTFAVKGSRFITHMLKLRNVGAALANFFASGVLALEDKLGPILWQFPPQLPFDGRFEAFLAQLPRDMAEAAALARRHDDRLRGRSFTAPRSRRPLSYAIEVRHDSFCTAEFVALLRRYGVALVVADTAGRWPFLEDVTADFVYVRLHGDVELYASGYRRMALKRWAERIHAWSSGGEPAGVRRISRPAAVRSRGRDVYVYFDNDAKVHAPFDALALRRMLGLEPGASSPTYRAIPAEKRGTERDDQGRFARVSSSATPRGRW